MYFSANAAMVFLNDSDIDDGFDTGEFSFDTGFGIIGAIGNAYNNGVRAEVEFGYRKNDVDKLSVDGFGSAPIDGDATALSLMANVLYDFTPGNSVSPFIGVGVGITKLEADVQYLGSDDDTVFAYQFTAGIGFAVSNNTKIDIQYRYFGTDDPEFGGIEAEYNAHNFMAGLRVSF